ncbi:MAG TPA: outer membrane lipid asymmetry maintenance protein MlaD, partial [Gammaproteobacteria bacterium]|nr:outer membrane lipid asymmetry maintenance protein MlaD [Gammaproteobacteria bacterium]
MSKRAVEISVGLFILFGILSLIVLALRVSGLSDIYSGQEG